jgi:hypothetical protein
MLDNGRRTREARPYPVADPEVCVRPALAALLFCPMLAQAAGPAAAPAVSEGGALCLPAIAAAERAEGIPAGLLRGIALVESGRADPSSGRPVPWPWTINAAGAGRYFASKQEAVLATRALLDAGVRSIDVGCGQVNLLHHPTAFASLEAAFDPSGNAAYAARFLRSLRASTGSWPQAAAAYHSRTPELGHGYAQRVMAAWPDAALHGPWPPAPTAPAQPGVARPNTATSPPRPDYSGFTPSFAARVRRMDEDRALQLAELRARVATPGVRLPPRKVSPAVLAARTGLPLPGDAGATAARTANLAGRSGG